MSDLIEFTVKNPAKVTSSPYTLRAKLSSTVKELKDIIKQEYDGHPETETQTLIYAGKVLREESALVKDFIHQHIDASASQSLHLVIKTTLPAAGPSQPQAAPPPQVTHGHNASGFMQTQRAPSPQVHVHTQSQPQNAAMMAAYQAALSAYISNQNMRPGPAQSQASAGQRNQAAASSYPNQQHPQQQAHPQQQQQQHQQQQQQQAHAPNQQAGAAAGNQAAVYPMHPPHMLAYVPVLLPAPYAAFPPAWAPQQQHQGQQAHQQGQAGQPPPAAPYPYPYPYLPGMPVMFPHGMPQQQGPAMPIRVQMAGGAFPGAGPNAGLRGGAGMAQGMPGGIFRMRRVPGMQVRMIRIDLKALLQVAVAGWVVYQHCPPGRFLILMAVAALIYLTGLTPLRQMLQRLANVNQLQPGRPAPAGAANQPAPAAAQQWTFLAELQAVVVGFISSLIPGWNMNADDAAAFAAAQQMQAAEAALEAQQQRGNDQPNLHQD